MLTPSPAFPRRVWTARRRVGAGLGQTAYCDANPLDPGCDPQNVGGVNFPSTGSPSAQSGGGILATLMPALTAGVTTAGKIALQRSSPQYLLAKQAISTPGTYLQQTPYGTMVASGGAAPIGAGLTTASLGSMLPILLIGLVVMMVARK